MAADAEQSSPVLRNQSVQMAFHLILHVSKCLIADMRLCWIL